ncbi:hypothetical protein EJ06DRAFT_405770 [Trichodelitschia bisporula]|uniref:Uncharacterized protein n=1 Tax=Trichodelitschia bisporula TaxID=703511 RepID=A0A6G1HXM6_9PEZI|nr:hypothetical protein EJ06DRAFT_405770 [Trichodelitschia bisporula]
MVPNVVVPGLLALAALFPLASARHAEGTVTWYDHDNCRGQGVHPSVKVHENECHTIPHEASPMSFRLYKMKHWPSPKENAECYLHVFPDAPCADTEHSYIGRVGDIKFNCINPWVNISTGYKGFRSVKLLCDRPGGKKRPSGGRPRLGPVGDDEVVKNPSDYHHPKPVAHDPNLNDTDGHGTDGHDTDHGKKTDSDSDSDSDGDSHKPKTEPTKGVAGGNADPHDTDHHDTDTDDDKPKAKDTKGASTVTSVIVTSETVLAPAVTSVIVTSETILAPAVTSVIVTPVVVVPTTIIEPSVTSTTVTSVTSTTVTSAVPTSVTVTSVTVSTVIRAPPTSRSTRTRTTSIWYTWTETHLSEQSGVTTARVVETLTVTPKTKHNRAPMATSGPVALLPRAANVAFAVPTSASLVRFDGGKDGGVLTFDGPAPVAYPLSRDDDTEYSGSFLGSLDAETLGRVKDMTLVGTLRVTDVSYDFVAFLVPMANNQTAIVYLFEEWKPMDSDSGSDDEVDVGHGNWTTTAATTSIVKVTGSSTSTSTNTTVLLPTSLKLPRDVHASAAPMGVGIAVDVRPGFNAVQKASVLRDLDEALQFKKKQVQTGRVNGGKARSAWNLGPSSFRTVIQ